MNIKIMSKDGITLKTKDTYIREDISVAVDDSLMGITPTGTYQVTDNGEYDITEYAKVNVNVASSGGSGIIEVDSLPTENVQTDTLYKVNGISDINVYVKTDGNNPSTLEEAIKSLGATPTINYYVVDSLPTSPSISNLQTFTPAHVYICNDIAYTYGNAGYGNMWLGIKDLVSSQIGVAHTDKGYVSNETEIGEQGIYVTYKKGSYGVYSNKFYVKEYNGGWVDYKAIFDKTITTFSKENIRTIPNYAFYHCTALTSVNLQSVEIINSSAFYHCTALTSVNLPNATKLGYSAFCDCHSLADVYLGYEGVVVLSGSVFFSCPNTKVHVRAEYLSEYQSDTNWADQVSNGYVTLVGDYED